MIIIIIKKNLQNRIPLKLIPQSIVKTISSSCILSSFGSRSAWNINNDGYNDFANNKVENMK